MNHDFFQVHQSSRLIIDRLFCSMKNIRIKKNKAYTMGLIEINYLVGSYQSLIENRITVLSGDFLLQYVRSIVYFLE
jgi:hypothetical protein